MIYGIGIDLMSVERIGAVHARFRARFPERVLHPAERRDFEGSKHPEVFLAKRFAVKEACAKALGLGFRGIAYRDIGVTQDRQRKPILVFSSELRSRMEALGIRAGHVSITDDAGMIAAVVVLETAGGAAPPA